MNVTINAITKVRAEAPVGRRRHNQPMTAGTVVNQNLRNGSLMAKTAPFPFTPNPH